MGNIRIVKRYDVVVIGSGIAGTTSALAARKKGKSVCVVTKGAGASELSSGLFDGISPESENIKTAIEFFKEKFSDIEFKEAFYISDMGYVKSACGALKCFGSINKDIKYVRIFWINGLYGMSGREIKDAISFHLNRMSFKNVSIDVQDVLFKRFEGRYFIRYQDLMGRKDVYDELFEKYLKLEDEKQVFIPLCGSIEQIERMALFPTFDSPSGLYLKRRFEEVLKKENIDFVLDEVISANWSNSSIKSLILKNNGELEADYFVLASGSFISGGLFSFSNKIKERIFNLKIVIENMEIEDAYPLDWLNYSLKNSQLFFKAGVKVDKYMRGISKDTNKPYENLFCAGSVVATEDYSNRKGMYSILTGYISGMNASGSSIQI